MRPNRADGRIWTNGSRLVMIMLPAATMITIIITLASDLW